MKKQKSKGSKKQKHHGKKKAAKDKLQSSWVEEHLDWISDDCSREVESCDTVSIVSWNVLADSYCSYRSHQHLPMKYQNHVFERPQRQHRVRQILRRFANSLACDLLALQEVDAPLEVPQCMKELGYSGVETPTCPAGRDGRVDSCALYFRDDDWRCLDKKILRLDDLSTLCTKTGKEGTPSIMAATSNLQGVQSSFVRKNMALLVKIQNKHNNRKLTVAVMHLYWNPSYDYVKLCQAHHVAQNAKQFSEGLPIIFCGDLNSKPNGYVYQYLVNGFVNARLAAPWYSYHYSGSAAGAGTKADADQGIASGLREISISNAPSTQLNPKIRYMLDYTLNRFCRWLRILGLDAALETEEEERLRTKEGKVTIFEQCRKEQRTLVTTSSRLLLRKDCPPGAYCLDTKSLSNLEITLVHMLLSHGVSLNPRNFLTRCVVCNGKIDKVSDEKMIEEIFASRQAPDNLNQEVMDVFQCTSCSQGYWWCDRPTSSASRVKNQATKLLETCIRGGVPVSSDMGMFSYVDVEEVKRSCPDTADERLLLDQRLDVLEWLQQERLENPCLAFRNVYASDEGNETLPFTNVTSDFVGHLDYVMYETDRLTVEERLFVPTSFEVLNWENLRNGHLLPSNVWPSDHLAVGGRFSFSEAIVTASNGDTSGLSPAKGAVMEASSESKPRVETSSPGPLPAAWCAPIQGSMQSPPPPPAPVPNHGQRCACGCVPNVLSLFEMAELRKQARLKRQQQQQ